MAYPMHNLGPRLGTIEKKGKAWLGQVVVELALPFHE